MILFQNTATTINCTIAMSQVEIHRLKNGNYGAQTAYRRIYRGHKNRKIKRSHPRMHL
jgi:hypothetical protein